MKTTIHTYCFDIRHLEQRAAWEALRDTLTASHPHCMESHGGALHYRPEWDGMEVELETECLFDNQWNTAPFNGAEKGYRLFDWALDYNPYSNASIKQGYYLDQTDEMRAVRRDVSKCGYCGAQEPTGKFEFCPHCIGSEYLKPEDLKLTRMRPIDARSTKFAELSADEHDTLIPLYREAQLHGNTDRDKARLAKQRADIASKYANAVRNATIERDGMTWLLDHGFKIDNVIFYTHTGKFGFGWRAPLESSLVSALLDVISEFPFPYEIKCADGKTLAAT